MEQLTIRELLKQTIELVRQGYGDKKIVISDDNEGNGYHGLFYGFTIKDLDYFKDDIYDTTTHDTKELVILG